jgi:hypothetical protein
MALLLVSTKLTPNTPLFPSWNNACIPLAASLLVKSPLVMEEYEASTFSIAAAVCGAILFFISRFFSKWASSRSRVGLNEKPDAFIGFPTRLPFSSVAENTTPCFSPSLVWIFMFLPLHDK